MGFGIYSGDVVIVILTQLHHEGKLLLIDTACGPLLRVAEPCNADEVMLYSGNQHYPVRGYKLNQVEVLGYASYFDRRNSEGQWEQFAVPDNLLSIARTLHRHNSNHRRQASCDTMTTKANESEVDH